MIGLCNRCGRSHELDTSAFVCGTFTTTYGINPCLRCDRLEAENAALRRENASYRQSRADMDARHAELSADLAAARKVLETAREIASERLGGYPVVEIDRTAWQAWQAREGKT